MTEETKAPDYLCTDLNEIPKIVDDLRTNYYESTPTSYEYRINQLKGLRNLLQENKEEISNVLCEYYGGFPTKHYLTRVYGTECEVLELIQKLRGYMNGKTKYPQAFPISIMWSAETKPHPLGVVCIIAPWNYPLSLMFRPLAGAIAAGNAVIIKPSEITDNISRLMMKLVPKYLDSKMIRVVAGGVPETSKLLEQKFDFIMFTGSTFVGKIVMQAAAKHLTPVCLELGGKNPVIIDDDANLENSIKRITYGRWWFNSGQVCICPEYLLISESRVAECIKYFRQYMKEFFCVKTALTPKDIKSDLPKWSESEHYGKIVNKMHWNRLNKLREHYIKNEPEKIVIGGNNKDDLLLFGEPNEETRHMPPMVLSNNINFYEDKIMQNEVFGPFLTIIGMKGKSIEWKSDAVDMIRSKGEPLVCYIFSPNNKFINYFDKRIAAGSITCNDCIYQMSLKEVPFGGIGQSGTGGYGGSNTFNLFSHFKPLNKRSHGLEFLNNDRYPPNDLTKVSGLLAKLKPGPASLKTQIIKYGLIILLAIIIARYIGMYYGIL